MSFTPFLQQVASDLIQRFGNDLSRVTVVFPNRRARLFFNEYLCMASDKPLWAPMYANLDELFAGASTLQRADSLKLLNILYKKYIEVYNKHTNTESVETFDEFYFFGEIILSDFNDVDKNMVNPMALFSNLLELEKLKDDFEHLDSAQWETVHRFFHDIATKPTKLKDAFFSIWNILGNVYTAFKHQLLTENIVYDGMLYRAVIEDLQTNGVQKFPQEKYIFVGFNVLTECEKALFKILKQNDKALFYWDYNEYYLEEKHEAGRFIRQNLQQFPSAIIPTDTTDFESNKQQVCMVESSSESAQAGYIEQWLKDIEFVPTDDVPDTAIVLCNEANLQAVMHTIPGETATGDPISANITMGFPLAQTPAFGLITALADLQLKGVDEANARFRYNFVIPVLQHPYIRLIFNEANTVEALMIKEHNFFPTQAELQNTQIFRPTANEKELAMYLLEIVQTVAREYGKTQPDENQSFTQLYSESLFRTFQSLNRLNDLLQTGELQVQKSTFVSLLKRMLGSTSIPFHGEPAKGLQIMGLLETRNLDFKNVLMLSVNESVLPKSENESSFIPHFIRQFFGMTTIEHQDSLYAYYFYRLLQRAENISLAYSTAAKATGKLEKSRYLLQLLTESNLKINQLTIKTELNPQQNNEIVVRKTEDLIFQLKNKYDKRSNPEAKSLSPSAFNSYLDCSLRFYLQYIAGIKPPQELTDELDNSVLGRVFHKAMELIYREMGHTPLTQQDITPFVVTEVLIDNFAQNKIRLEAAIEEAFNQEFFGKRKVAKSRYNGEQLIYFRIIKQLIKRLLNIDKTHAPFTLKALEKEEYRDIELNEMLLKVGGTIDRIDEKGRNLRIVDYKTGGRPVNINSMEKLFAQGKDRASYVFQAFLYSSILVEKQPEAVVPALIYIQKAIEDDYSPIIKWQNAPITDFRELNDDFEVAFREKLSELFDPEIPFIQTDNEYACEWCNFKRMCGR